MVEIKYLDGFTGYKNVTTRLLGDLNQLQEYNRRFKLVGNAEVVGETLKRLADDSFNVAVIGEFNRGKSTVINTLMGKSILPMDILPTTATLNKITFSVEPYISVEFKDGHTEKIDIEQLEAYVTKLSAESEKMAATIKEATVYYPISYCKNGVTIIDTPGLNDEGAMTDVTLSVLNRVDAAIMVIMANAPFSESERLFLENKVISSDLGKVMFVVTGMDIVGERDAERVVEHIKKSIQEKIILKAEAVYGAGSDEYEAYVRKIGKIRIYGVSAVQALKAKQRGDDALLAQSRFTEFENALEQFLSEDRAAVVLNAPISRVKKASLEIVKAAELRLAALELEKAEFEKRFGEAKASIEDIRLKRREESRRIKEAADKTIKGISPDISNYWQRMKEVIVDVVDSYGIVGDDIKKENIEHTTNALNSEVKKAMELKSQNLLEKIQNNVMNALSDEAHRLEGFEREFHEATAKIHSLFVEPASVKEGAGKGLAFSSVLNGVFYGLGSAIDGYRQAGWKGAIIGGASGLGAGVIGFEIATGLMIAIGLPIAWPMVVIGGAFAAIFGALLGKKFTSIFTRNTQIKKFKDSYRENMIESLNKMREEGDFTRNMDNQVREMFAALEKKMNDETEAILRDTETQLTQLHVDIARNEQMGADEKGDIQQIVEELDAMCVYANEVEAELTAIMSR